MIKSGTVNEYVEFIAPDASDPMERLPGLTSFTVYRSRGGSNYVAMTTPTVVELTGATGAATYKLLMDEDMTISSGKARESMLFHITSPGMVPQTVRIQLYEPANEVVKANVTEWAGTTVPEPAVTGVPKVDVTHCASAAQSAIASPANVNEQVLDVLTVDTFAQPGQGAPPATTSILNMLRWLFKAWRNPQSHTSDSYRLYADDGTTVDQKATALSDASTFTRGKIGTGP